MKLTKEQLMIVGGLTIVALVIYLSTRKKTTTIEIKSGFEGDDFDI